MAVCTFASIYIGSYEVSMKVFEFSSGKRCKQIDYIRSRIDLGRSAYLYGTIGYELVEQLCDTLEEFSSIMKGYKVDDYEIYSSGAMKNVQNVLFVLNQVYIRTGFSIKIISNSELRFIGYKSVAGTLEFEELIKTSAAVVDMGSFGVQITLFDKGKLITTQSLSMGAMKLRNLLADEGNTLSMYIQQMEEYIQKKIEVFSELYLKDKVENIVLINDYGIEIMKRFFEKKSKDGIITAKQFLKNIDKLLAHSVEEIAKELKLSNDKDSFIVPSLLIIRNTIRMLEASNVWIPQADINDGIACDFGGRNKLIPATHDFEKDIRSAALNLAKQYKSYSKHVDSSVQLAVLMFDELKKVHKMGKRQRLLIEVAAILHDCGKYISLSQSAQNSYQIIMSSEILGLSHLEREIIALTVLYNDLELDDYEAMPPEISQQDYLVIAKLSSILRVVNALDQSHRQKLQNVKIKIKGQELIITVDSFSKLSLEKALFSKKTEFFENVFSVRPILKEHYLISE